MKALKFIGKFIGLMILASFAISAFNVIVLESNELQLSSQATAVILLIVMAIFVTYEFTKWKMLK